MNKKSVMRWLAMVGLLMGSSGAWAAFTDGFETGLGGWTASGPVQAVEFEYARNLGLNGNWLPTEGAYFASLWTTDSDAYASSQMSRSFEGIAGDYLRFDYYFDFNDADLPETESPTAQWDRAMAELSSADGTIELFDRSSTTSGWLTLSYQLPKTQTYELRFSAFDWDGTFESILGVDRVSVGATIIPAPGALLLVGAGTCVVGWLRRKRTL